MQKLFLGGWLIRWDSVAHVLADDLFRTTMIQQNNPGFSRWL
jgi:hypothetical protein